MSRAEIWVKFQQEGFHCWQGATGRRAYLGNVHRHVFHVRVQVSVGHDDRDVEFHDLKELSQSLFSGINLTTKSCEMMARALGQMLLKHYPQGCEVSVSEDDECGATVRLEGSARE